MLVRQGTPHTESSLDGAAQNERSLSSWVDVGETKLDNKQHDTIELQKDAYTAQLLLTSIYSPALALQRLATLAAELLWRFSFATTSSSYASALQRNEDLTHGTDAHENHEQQRATAGALAPSPLGLLVIPDVDRALTRCAAKLDDLLVFKQLASSHEKAVSFAKEASEEISGVCEELSALRRCYFDVTDFASEISKMDFDADADDASLRVPLHASHIHPSLHHDSHGAADDNQQHLATASCAVAAQVAGPRTNVWMMCLFSRIQLLCAAGKVERILSANGWHQMPFAPTDNDALLYRVLEKAHEILRPLEKETRRLSGLQLADAGCRAACGETAGETSAADVDIRVALLRVEGIAPSALAAGARWTCGRRASRHLSARCQSEHCARLWRLRSIYRGVESAMCSGVLLSEASSARVLGEQERDALAQSAAEQRRHPRFSVDLERFLGAMRKLGDELLSAGGAAFHPDWCSGARSSLSESVAPARGNDLSGLEVWDRLLVETVTDGKEKETGANTRLRQLAAARTNATTDTSGDANTRPLQEQRHHRHPRSETANRRRRPSKLTG